MLVSQHDCLDLHAFFHNIDVLLVIESTSMIMLKWLLV